MIFFQSQRVHNNVPPRPDVQNDPVKCKAVGLITDMPKCCLDRVSLWLTIDYDNIAKAVFQEAGD